MQNQSSTQGSHGEFVVGKNDNCLGHNVGESGVYVGYKELENLKSAYRQINNKTNMTTNQSNKPKSEQRYTITKIRNGLWVLEFEDGFRSEHSMQAGAERMVLQLTQNTTNQSNWESRFDTSFDEHSPVKLLSFEKTAVKDFIRTLLKEQRDEAQEEYKQFILNVLDGVDIADGECNTKAIRLAIESRMI